ncbi:MAG: hypothetical protein ABI067_11980 [Leifsonia sp.]
MSAQIAAGSSGGLPDITLVITGEGSDDELAVQHLAPHEAVALAVKLVDAATVTMQFNQLVRDV